MGIITEVLYNKNSFYHSEWLILYSKFKKKKG